LNIYLKEKAMVKTDTLCGCKTCVCEVGGYQVHLTLKEVNSSVLKILEERKTELIVITNYVPDHGTYDEFITSKNYHSKYSALLGLFALAKRITDETGVEILRHKIESHPKNNEIYFYKEVHYKIDPEDIPRLRPYCFFSKNAKGTLFATERFSRPIEPIIRHTKYVIEDVIYDTNLALDDRLVKNVDSSGNGTQTPHTAMQV